VIEALRRLDQEIAKKLNPSVKLGSFDYIPPEWICGDFERLTT